MWFVTQSEQERHQNQAGLDLSSALQNEEGSIGFSWTVTSVFTSLGKTKASQIGYMETHSRLQNFLRPFFEKEMFCSENRPVKGVFPLINIMHLTELP